jgi:chaperonin GroES
MAHVGTQPLGVLNRKLAALAPACESDDFVAAQREDIRSMTFRPLHDRVLVRRIEAAEKTTGGIIIPDSAKEKPQEGEIVAVGAGTRDENGMTVPLDLQAGDKILFGKWSGTEVKLGDEDLIIMKESDVLGVLG